MDLVVGDALTRNILVNGAALVLVVAQCIEYLREGQMGEADNNLFRCDAKLPQLGDGSHRCASSHHNGCAVENVVRGDDIGLASRQPGLDQFLEQRTRIDPAALRPVLGAAQHEF